MPAISESVRSELNMNNYIDMGQKHHVDVIDIPLFLTVNGWRRWF